LHARAQEKFLTAATFWSIAGLMVIAAIAVIVLPLFLFSSKREPALSAGARLRKLWPAIAIAVLVPFAALGIYSVTGTPPATVAVAATPSTTNDVATLHARTATQGGESAGDLGQAVERLQARLAANPNDANGWRLLAQSYEYLGRPADAAEANKHADEAARAGGTMDFAPGALAAISGARDGAVQMPAPAPATRPASSGDDAVNQLVQSAQDYRRRREFRQANQAFAELARRGQMDANLWADYADSLGG